MICLASTKLANQCASKHSARSVPLISRALGKKPATEKKSVLPVVLKSGEAVSAEATATKREEPARKSRRKVRFLFTTPY